MSSAPSLARNTTTPSCRCPLSMPKNAVAKDGIFWQSAFQCSFRVWKSNLIRGMKKCLTVDSWLQFRRYWSRWLLVLHHILTYKLNYNYSRLIKDKWRPRYSYIKKFIEDYQIVITLWSAINIQVKLQNIFKNFTVFTVGKKSVSLTKSKPDSLKYRKVSRLSQFHDLVVKRLSTDLAGTTS